MALIFSLGHWKIAVRDTVGFLLRELVYPPTLEQWNSSSLLRRCVSVCWKETELAIKIMSQRVF